MVTTTNETTLADVVINAFKNTDIIISKIVIFGSVARGNDRIASDVDIVIVSASYRDMGILDRVALSTGVNRALVEILDRPVDTVYYSDIEWENDTTLIIREAKQTGEIIYDAEALVSSSIYK